MASSTEQTIKQEPSLASSSSSEQSTANMTIKPEFNTTLKKELNAIMKPEDETFEQFYSEVINL
jgi:hypothetical protein